LTNLAGYPPFNSANFELFGMSGRSAPHRLPWQQVAKGEKGEKIKNVQTTRSVVVPFLVEVGPCYWNYPSL